VPARVEPEKGEKFDFDAVAAQTLDRFDWVLTSATAYASQPPENFELAKRTPSFALWARTGPTAERAILAEGTAPGTEASCGEVRGAETVGAWPKAPLEWAEGDWLPSATIAPGESATQSLNLGEGSWELSLAYDSPRPVTLEVSGPGLGRRLLTFPANLDFRGPTPPYPASETIDVPHEGTFEVVATLADAPLAGRLLGAEGDAHLRGLVAVDTAAPVAERPGRAACGVYVDWLATTSP
jgi:hypothetical protein